ncbi:MAG TPA: FAD-dependent oxidoreductase, partial [Burkholderiales bacterium]|nr:FAD-dependent oxidoreductase [Burkholderiales bacterium]
PLFYEAIRQYYPALKDGQLQPGYTGIRPKISGPKEPAADFLVQGPREHGVPGLVNLYGIESPGLTASLAIAEHVKQLLAT